MPFVVFGDGLKGEAHVHFRGLRTGTSGVTYKHLKRKEKLGEVLVLDINEFRTASVCPSCHERNLKNHQAEGRTFFGILTCNGCNIFWNCDVLAAKNMMFIASEIWVGRGRPEVFTRYIERGCLHKRLKDITEYMSDSDEEYGPIATTWGSQAPVEPEKNNAGWDSLVDPNIKVGPNDLGSGNLHRRGTNYKPIDEELILAKRLNKQVSKKTMQEAIRKTELDLGLSASADNASRKGKPKKKTTWPTNDKFSQKPYTSLATSPLTQKSTTFSTLRPPPPPLAVDGVASKWSNSNLVETPFWEGQNTSSSSESGKANNKWSSAVRDFTAENRESSTSSPGEWVISSNDHGITNNRSRQNSKQSRTVGWKDDDSTISDSCKSPKSPASTKGAESFHHHNQSSSNWGTASTSTPVSNGRGISPSKTTNNSWGDISNTKAVDSWNSTSAKTSKDSNQHATTSTNNAADSWGATSSSISGSDQWGSKDSATPTKDSWGATEQGDIWDSSPQGTIVKEDQPAQNGWADTWNDSRGSIVVDSSSNGWENASTFSSASHEDSHPKSHNAASRNHIPSDQPSWLNPIPDTRPSSHSSRFSNPHKQRYSDAPINLPEPTNYRRNGPIRPVNTAPPPPPPNALLITINVELSATVKIPVDIRELDDPGQLAADFGTKNNISTPKVIDALTQLFASQKEMALKKRQQKLQRRVQPRNYDSVYSSPSSPSNKFSTYSRPPSALSAAPAPFTRKAYY